MKAIILTYTGDEASTANVNSLCEWISRELGGKGITICTLNDEDVSNALLKKTKLVPSVNASAATFVDNKIEEIIREKGIANSQVLLYYVLTAMEKDPVFKHCVEHVVSNNIEIKHNEIIPLIKLVIK